MSAHDKDHESIGQRLKRLRMEAGLTGHALERKARLSSKTIWGVESGNHMPRVDTAISIAMALGVSLDYLCCLTDVLHETWRKPDPSAKKDMREQKAKVYRQTYVDRKADEAERLHQERIREELARPVRRDPFSAALFGAAQACASTTTGRIYRQDMSITNDDEVAA